MTTGTYPQTNTRPNALLRKGAIAAGLLIVLNSVLFLLGSTLSDEAFSTLTFPAVIFTSLAAAAGGTLVYALLTRFTARPTLIFRVISVAVLLFSLGGPLSMEEGTEMATMLLMHVVSAAVVVYTLTKDA